MWSLMTPSTLNYTPNFMGATIIGQSLIATSVLLLEVNKKREMICVQDESLNGAWICAKF